MKLNFYLVGKVKEEYLKQGYNEYVKRLSKYGQVNIIYIQESNVIDESNQSLIQKALDEEASRIIKVLDKNSTNYLIDLHGKMYDSIEFSKIIEQGKDKSISLNFIIGSSYGLSNKLREISDYKICLSKLTTTHPLALLFILEQVCRGFKILSNQTYHK